MPKVKKLHLLFNHHLTEKQVNDAHESLGITHIEPLPEMYLEQWKNIPSTKPYLKESLYEIYDYLMHACKRGDYLLVQGDFGATYLVVQKALSLGVVPIYATTQRKSVEKVVKGKTVKTSVFEHGIYREYGV